MLQDIYNNIASTYDQDVLEMNRLELFPYDHYDDLLTTISSIISSQDHLETVQILDLGIGTANLYSKVMPERTQVVGLDFSRQMLEIAKLKCPNVTFVCHDFMKGLPEEYKHYRFDFIVSTYAIHDLDTNQLLDTIHYYLQFLNPMGKLILGDNLFLDYESSIRTKEKYLDSWNELSHYHIYNQLVSKINANLSLSYMKLSVSTGLIIIENVHECALQFEENLVQYVSNTMKWKSSPIRKKSE